MIFRLLEPNSLKLESKSRKIIKLTLWIHEIFNQARRWSVNYFFYPHFSTGVFERFSRFYIHLRDIEIRSSFHRGANRIQWLRNCSRNRYAQKAKSQNWGDHRYREFYNRSSSKLQLNKWVFAFVGLQVESQTELIIPSHNQSAWSQNLNNLRSKSDRIELYLNSV